MAKETTVQVRLDSKTKKEAQKIAADLGMTLSDVVQVKLRSFVRERGLSAYTPLKPTKKLEKILAKAEKDIKSGKNLSPAFDNVEDVISWLEDKKRK